MTDSNHIPNLTVDGKAQKIELSLSDSELGETYRIEDNKWLRLKLKRNDGRLEKVVYQLGDKVEVRLYRIVPFMVVDISGRIREMSFDCTATSTCLAYHLGIEIHKITYTRQFDGMGAAESVNDTPIVNP